eukprot:XP_020397299.1 uncharacterized protein DKFZp434B061-like [Zea mays]
MAGLRRSASTSGQRSADDGERQRSAGRHGATHRRQAHSPDGRYGRLSASLLACWAANDARPSHILDRPRATPSRRRACSPPRATPARRLPVSPPRLLAASPSAQPPPRLAAAPARLLACSPPHACSPSRLLAAAHHRRLLATAAARRRAPVCSPPRATARLLSVRPPARPAPARSTAASPELAPARHRRLLAAARPPARRNAPPRLPGLLSARSGASTTACSPRACLMSKKVKQLAKGLARRASIFGRKEDLVFQGTSSSSSRRRALLEHVPELQG